MGLLIGLSEKGWLPDSLIRMGIRRLCAQRFEAEKDHREKDSNYDKNFVSMLKNSPIAVNTNEANTQHYELPPEFFDKVLGKYRKYSSCYWQEGNTSLDEAERASLEITCQRAGLQDGMDILELGCGWGSLSLWMAQNYPQSRIVSVSNSALQREFIENQKRQRGIENLKVITCDMNQFDPRSQFDRIVSIEMFEHMRNYQLLFSKVSSWLKDQGKLFVHIFCHRQYTYLFETQGDDNWMGRYFFTGGIMPSEHLFSDFNDDLKIEEQWFWEGVHYQKTSEAWLDNMDRLKDEIMPIIKEVYGARESTQWFGRWRIFFMSCAELFGYQSGQQWGVAHYLFKKS